MKKGAFLLVLHNHLPYCKKAGVWPHGEEWVWEAMNESYIPVINLLYDLWSKGVPVNITLCFSPVLLEQLSDKYMKDGFTRYMKERIRLAAADSERFRRENEPEFADLADMYRAEYEKTLRIFAEKFNGDLPRVLAQLANEGCIEIMASAATHAYLPLLETEESVRIQVAVGIEACRKRFGTSSRGFWLPECAYFPPGPNRPGLEDILGEYGIEYFLVDAHALQGGKSAGVYLGPGGGRAESYSDPIPGRTTFLPYTVGNSSLRVLGRNLRIGLQVWSECWGYPADSAYREFHKRHERSGLRYWRITNKLIDLGGKAPYEPELAARRAREHAVHFAGLIARQLKEFCERTGMNGVIVAPFDMELFGHWWFEGVQWLQACFDEFSARKDFRMMTVSQCLENLPPAGNITLPESSWGEGGGHRVWDNDRTSWMWENMRRAERKMLASVREMQLRPARLPYFEQAARELLLMQSSDWAFLVGTGQAEDYGNRRFLDHLSRFEHLLETNDPQSLRWIRERDNIFGDIELLDHWYRVAGKVCPSPGARTGTRGITCKSNLL